MPCSIKFYFRLILALLLGVPLAAEAHKASDSYLRLTPDNGGLNVDWRVGLRDLDAILDLDRNGDGRLTWREVEAQSARIATTLETALRLEDRDGAPCSLTQADFGYAQYGDGGYVVLRWQAACAAPVLQRVRSTLFAHIDPNHRVLLTTGGAPLALAPEETRSLNLSLAPVAAAPEAMGGAAQITPPLPPPPVGHPIAEFVREGVWHIWSGADHILFLLALLVTAVVRREGHSWVPETGLRAVLVRVGGTATAFTLSHSVALALAVFGVLNPPSSLIEPVIALTVLLAAVHNLRRLWSAPATAVAFGFGFIHGFGFADALVPLQLNRAELAGALLGFNVGVELGQLAIIGAFCLVAYPLRAWRGYPAWFLRGGSGLTAVIAGIWFIERVGGWRLIPGLP